ncbi:MAG: hypothetical protein WC733_08800 [Methylophilus sp.]
MNWNQNRSNWPELKRQAKRQDAEATRYSFNATNPRSFRDIHTIHESSIVIKARAELQFLESHD